MTWSERLAWVATGLALGTAWRMRGVWRSIDRLFKQIHDLWVQIGHIHDLLGSDFNERTPPDMNLPRAGRKVMRLDRDRRSDAR